MHAALRLGGRDPLDPVDPGFPFQAAIDAVAFDIGDDFLIAANIAFRGALQVNLPTLHLRVS